MGGLVVRAQAPVAAPRVVLADALAGKANSLNLLRLVFAVAVVVSHSWLLTGRSEPAFAGMPLGGWAVAGFFGISGYLIPQARLRTDLVTFALRRGRRIYPGFWACCVVVAFGFAPVAALLTGARYDPTLAGRYVVGNVTTHMAQPMIGAETAGAPPGLAMWNGPAWTLVFELMCYAIAAAVLSLRVARRHLPLVAVALYSVAAVTAIATTNPHGAAWFAALFAAGWVVGTLADRLVVTPACTVSAALVAAPLALVHPVLATIPMAYAVLGAGVLVPARWCTRTDVSYGTYLYGWPVQQVLLAVGVTSLPLFVASSVALALAAGAVSWNVVERRCLRR